MPDSTTWVSGVRWERLREVSIVSANFARLEPPLWLKVSLPSGGPCCLGAASNDLPCLLTSSTSGDERFEVFSIFWKQQWWPSWFLQGSRHINFFAQTGVRQRESKNVFTPGVCCHAGQDCSHTKSAAEVWDETEECVKCSGFSYMDRPTQLGLPF